LTATLVSTAVGLADVIGEGDVGDVGVDGLLLQPVKTAATDPSNDAA